MTDMTERHPDYPPTPELDKLLDKTTAFNAIMQFLDYLDDEDIVLRRFSEDTGLTYVERKANLPYEFFDIDPKEVEKERQAILEFLQVFNVSNPPPKESG